MNEENENLSEVVDIEAVTPVETEVPVAEPVAKAEPAEPQTGRDKAAAAFDKLVADKDDKPTVAKTAEANTEQTHTETTEAKHEKVKGLDPSGRGPNTWNALEREEFSKCTPVAQQAILRRELEHQRLMAETTDVRKFASEFVTAVNPYQAFLDSQKVPALYAVKDLLNTAYTMKTGDARTKAEMAAAIIRNNNVDVSLIDQFLTNSAPQVDPQIAAMQRELAELRGSRQQEEQARQSQSTQQLDQTIEAFANDPANEFFSDVVGDMQVLLANGRAADLKDAYDKACKINADVTNVLQTRNTALSAPVVAATTQSQVTTQQKLNASASVKGAPATTRPAAAKPKLSGRDAAMAAWEKLSNK